MGRSAKGVRLTIKGLKELQIDTACRPIQKEVEHHDSFDMVGKIQDNENKI